MSRELDLGRIRNAPRRRVAVIGHGRNLKGVRRAPRNETGVHGRKINLHRRRGACPRRRRNRAGRVGRRAAACVIGGTGVFRCRDRRARRIAHIASARARVRRAARARRVPSGRIAASGKAGREDKHSGRGSQRCDRRAERVRARDRSREYSQNRVHLSAHLHRP